MTDIEELCVREFGEGVSPGAAARQMCRSLQDGSKVKEMLERMLSDANLSSFDRSQILSDFEEINPEAALAARVKSFHRINRSTTNA